jgi:chaperone modulatory protein CbpM
MRRRDTEDLRGVVLDATVTFSLSQVCRACDIQQELVMEMVSEGVIEPAGSEPGDLRFTGEDLVRAQRAARLVRDLDVNWPGAALALELLDELDRLERRLRRL